jgi:hypothetical protein
MKSGDADFMKDPAASGGQIGSFQILMVSQKVPNCHPERSEGSRFSVQGKLCEGSQNLLKKRDSSHSLRMTSTL